MNITLSITRIRHLFFCLSLLLLVSCTKNTPAADPALTNADDFHQHVCELDIPNGDASPWHIRHLYNCASRTLFIPYPLFTGSDWDGQKTGDCMHTANHQGWVNGRVPVAIEGPHQWTHPVSKRTYRIWQWRKNNADRVLYYTCHDRGIARVYDSRRPTHVYEQGRCRFPGNFGWALQQRRQCADTTIEILTVTVDAQHRLHTLRYRRWYGDTEDGVYTFQRSHSLVSYQAPNPQ